MLRPSDLKVLVELRRNSRSNLSELSRKTKLPISTLFDKLKRFNKSIIRKNAALLNFRYMGLERKKVFLKVAKNDQQKLLVFLKSHPAVNTLYKVDNRFDFLAEIIFAGLTEYYRFLKELEQFDILSKEDYSIIEEFRHEDYLTLPN